MNYANHCAVTRNRLYAMNAEFPLTSFTATLIIDKLIAEKDNNKKIISGYDVATLSEIYKIVINSLLFF